MTSNERYILRIQFQLKVYRADGQAYQDLFVSVMEKFDPGFRKIKLQGRLGDRGNDGYIPATGTYFQVYAPEHAEDKVQDAVKKVKDDFKKILNYWDNISKIKSFNFVFNDKYKGTFPEIEKVLAEIKHKYKLDNCSVLLPKNLEDLVFALPEEDIFDLIGMAPSVDSIRDIDYAELTDVLIFIMKNELLIEDTIGIDPPDFDEKIEYNKLSIRIAHLLQSASYQVGVVEDYFENNSNFSKEDIRDRIKGIYIQAKSDHEAAFKDGILDSDALFLEVLYRITNRQMSSTQTCALVLMAYFFEACDLFEDPNLK